MMELGAVICVPVQPRCLLCPLSALCISRSEIPKREEKPRQQKREISFGLARHSGQVLLVQRGTDEPLMPNMWELPAFSGNDPNAKPLLSVRHSITVTDYSVRVFEVLDGGDSIGKWIPTSRLKSMPLTGLARKILRRIDLM